METCSGCGLSIATTDVLYTSDARIVCAKCFDKADVADTDLRAARNIKVSATTSLGTAVLGWFFNPVFVVSLFAGGAGIYAIRSLLPGNERFSKLLSGSDKLLVLVCAGGGLALTVLQVMLAFGVIGHRRY